jgi:REP element-mobilizing transposase RayT
LYHIVFCTYNRQDTIPPEQEEALYKYIHGVIKRRKGVLYEINGMKNHLHILSDLHPTMALSDFIKEIKTATNFWMHESGKYPLFVAWAEGYCAMTYTFRDKEMITNYIRNQKEHHKKVAIEEEYRALLEENGVVIDERYLF